MEHTEAKSGRGLRASDWDTWEGTLSKAIGWIKARQGEDGMWCAPLETNCCMESQWILAMDFIGRDDPKKPRILEYIRSKQREDGAWDVYYGAEKGDVNTTLECYYALRISGEDPDAGHMRKAREWLISHDWVRNIRVFTKYWLALFGEWDWDKTPALPPEIIFTPPWCPFNIYDFAAWARCTMLPLSIVTARRPVKRLPDSLRMDELFPGGREGCDFRLPRKNDRVFSWENLFMKVDSALHTYGRMKSNPFREAAIKRVMEWLLERQDEDGAWGGIQPPWIYSIIAMHIEGFPHTQKNMASAIEAFDAHWKVDTGHGLMLQASESPVWDTLLTMISLSDSGETLSTSPELRRALDYVLNKENSHYGDWAVKAGKEVSPSGWAFQRANNYYPDIDDAAVAVIALRKLRATADPSDPDIARIDAAVSRAVEWLLHMQSSNGGWAAFDKDNTREIVTKIPFCDFGEVLDPPSVDVTAHVVEALANCGYDRKHPAVARALEFIYSEQEDDGSWFGRWGVNYIYGTWLAVTGLCAIGDDWKTPAVARALDWLESKQNPDGGWGESVASYMEPRFAGSGIPSTASQTAWAVAALLASGDPARRGSVERAMRFFSDTQTPDGTWDEPYYTGTGFPGYGLGAKVDLKNGAPLPQGKDLSRGFMLNYHWYRHYFPISSMGRFLRGGEMG